MIRTFLFFLLFGTTVSADQVRVATYAAPLSRKGPGLLLADIHKGSREITAIANVVAAIAPDVLLLTDVDYDRNLSTLDALRQVFADAGSPYPHSFAFPPTSIHSTDIDLDGDGRLRGAGDRQGFGFFAGDNGMAVLSRIPIDPDASRDFSNLLWRDLPDATLPMVGGAPFPSEAAQTIQRLSSSGHWEVVLRPTDFSPFSLLAFSATPPVFDGDEDQNGLRNRDELRFWTLFLDGEFGPTPATFIVIGNSNLDPVDGDGFATAMAAFLDDPRLQDPRPQSAGGTEAADADQVGPPEQDTADWPDGAPGNLRVSYVLPSTDWRVLNTGVFWPSTADPQFPLLDDTGPHRLVWVDLALP